MATEVTNNNNINNIITTNNNIVSNDCDITQSNNNNVSLDESLRSSFEEMKESGCESGSNATRQNGLLPRLWQWVKVDLFDNSDNHKPRHKIALSICKSNEINRFRSLNNSPFANFKRGFVDYKNDPHYNLVRDLYHELKQQGYQPRVSKCFLPGYKNRKGSTVKRLSTILVSEAQERRYTLALIHKDTVMWIALRGDVGDLSEKQRANRMIATGKITEPAASYGKDIDDVL